MGQVLHLLDRLRDLSQHVVAQIQGREILETGDALGEALNIVVVGQDLLEAVLNLWSGAGHFQQVVFNVLVREFVVREVDFLVGVLLVIAGTVRTEAAAAGRQVKVGGHVVAVVM